MDKISGKLKVFLDLIADVKKEYSLAEEHVIQEDKITQDLLHKLEIEKTTAKERGRIATDLKVSRQTRRYYKDRIEEMTPLYEFLTDSNNAKVLNNLTQVLGKIRKAERYHETRTYKPRVKKEGCDGK